MDGLCNWHFNNREGYEALENICLSGPCLIRKVAMCQAPPKETSGEAVELPSTLAFHTESVSATPVKTIQIGAPLPKEQVRPGSSTMLLHRRAGCRKSAGPGERPVNSPLQVSGGPAARASIRSGKALQNNLPSQEIANNRDGSTKHYKRDASIQAEDREPSSHRATHVNSAECRTGESPCSGLRPRIHDDSTASPKVSRPSGISTGRRTSVGTSTAPPVRTQDAATSLFACSRSDQSPEGTEQGISSYGEDSVTPPLSMPKASPESRSSPVGCNVRADLTEEQSECAYVCKREEKPVDNVTAETVGNTAQPRDTTEETSIESEEAKPLKHTVDVFSGGSVGIEQPESKVTLICDIEDSGRQNQQESVLVTPLGEAMLRLEKCESSSDTFNDDAEVAQVQKGAKQLYLERSDSCHHDCEIEEGESNLEDAPEDVEWIPASNESVPFDLQSMVDPTLMCEERINVKESAESRRASEQMHVLNVAEAAETDTQNSRPVLAQNTQASAAECASRGTVLWKAHVRESIHIEFPSSSNIEALTCIDNLFAALHAAMRAIDGFETKSHDLRESDGNVRLSLSSCEGK